MARSRRRVALSFLFSFKGLASTIAVMGCFFFTCSFLLNVHVGSSTPTDHEVLGLKQYERNDGRHPLSLTSNALKAQLKETVRSVVDYQGLVLMHGSIARKLKLENSKLVRNFAEISINFTDLIKKASHCDVSDSNTALVHRFLKQAKEKVKFAKQLISNSKGSFDSQLKIQKLKDTIFGLEGQMTKMKTKGELAKSIAAKAIPRNLHCLALRLMQERIENPIRYINKQTKSRQPRQEFEDPNLYHYAIFSDNVLAASVVVNSVVQNAKEPWKHVLHIVTERTTLAAMKVMFKLKDHNGTHIEVKAVEDYKFLNSSYVPVLRQQESAELLGYYYGNGLENSTTGSSNLKFRNPKYLSMLNHLRFYLPEMYPKLHKILFLDDDVVVQKDLTGLWEIDMDGKVNGAVETCFGSFHRYDKYLKFDHPLIKETFDPKACAWAYGMNIFDLDSWRRDNCTEKYHYWQELNGNRTLWRLGTLPPGLITFYSTTKPLDKSWHVLGLGYNPGLSEEKIQNAAVIHYNGDSKPWLATAIPRYQPLWTKYVDYDLEFFRACNFAP
uniref:Hexosyltransferase n=1 Tax=Populus trichocarpa TaxID=3694 RepID=A0A2K1Z9P8_POPTR|eukprot:XP_024462493.1 galacturonosyltransferase 8 isoform X1 [Populus trichocarpa]